MTDVLEAELLDEGEGGDEGDGGDVARAPEGPRVWLAIVCASASAKGLAAGEWAGEHGADLVEVRPETVVFQVAAAEKGRVRAALDARGGARHRVFPLWVGARTASRGTPGPTPRAASARAATTR